MLLAVDIGNTNITLGVFENESILETFRLASDKELPQEEYEILLHSLFKKYDITACIIASVVDELNKILKRACDNVFHIDSLLLSPKLNELFVTPKNIDESIKQLSFLLSEGLNIALLGNKEENAGI